MIISIIILIFTVILTILDKFVLNEKADLEGVKTKHNLLYRLIKSKYTLLILIVGILVFQVIEAFRAAEAERTLGTNVSNTNNNVSKTYDKLLETNSSIENLLTSLNTTLQITKQELLVISNVNDDIKNVRKGIEDNIFEFNSIKTQYEKQINIEKEKIENAKPALQAIVAISIIDSLTFKYQFRLINNGIRIADSIIYHSLMVFIGLDNKVCAADLYKTNSNGTNVLSIAGNESGINILYLNSNHKDRNELTTFKSAFLLVKFKYIDRMTSKSDGDFKIFLCQSLEKGNQQYSSTTPKQNTELVKNYLLLKNKEYYKIFFTD
jgi:hypothetical protein